MSFSMIAEKHAALVAQCPSPPPRLPEAEASLLPIHVERFGTTGPLVVIIHGGVQGGIGGGPATFARQNTLADLDWQVAIVDRPGFGRSPSRGVDDMAADAVWVADMLGDGANLIGHSWGGATALLAAARRPDGVRSLVLVEPALQGLAMADPEFETNPAVKAAVMRFIEPLLTARTPGDYARAFTRTLVEPPGMDNAVGVVERDDAAATQLGCSILQGRMALPPALRQAAEIVAQAKIPVLVVSGGWNPSIDVVAGVVARATGGRHATVPSPNHFPQFENPDEFNRVVDAFMRESDPGIP